MKEVQTALPDAIINSLSILKYEANMLCLTHDIDAIQLDFQKPIPPGKEKCFDKEHRDVFSEMYSAL